MSTFILLGAMVALRGDAMLRCSKRAASPAGVDSVSRISLMCGALLNEPSFSRTQLKRSFAGFRGVGYGVERRGVASPSASQRDPPSIAKVKAQF
jgi:hypothetical protein